MNKEYLFHYTNLQSLALILKTKTIKFNSLINMDDKEEKITYYVHLLCAVYSAKCFMSTVPYNFCSSLDIKTVMPSFYIDKNI